MKDGLGVHFKRTWILRGIFHMDGYDLLLEDLAGADAEGALDAANEEIIHGPLLLQVLVRP